MSKQARPDDCCTTFTNVAPLLPDEQANQVEVWKALEDPTRLEMYRLIAGQPAGLCACDIVDRFKLAQPTIAHHLEVLRVPAWSPLLIRRRPEDLDLRPDGRPAAELAGSITPPTDGVTLHQALREPAFWWLTAAFFLGTLSSVTVAVHLIPFLLADGYDPGFAAVATGLIGATQVASRVVITVAGNRIRAVPLTAAVLALQGAAVLVLLSWQQVSGVLLEVVLLGAGRGAVTLMRATLIADRYGRTHYGAIGGALALLVSGAAALALVGVGMAYQVAGGYPLVFAGLAGIGVLAALVMVGMWQWG